MKNCYFTVGYIPAEDMKNQIELINWCGERNIETLFLAQTAIVKPGGLANAAGAPNVTAVIIPYMKTTQENFKKIFGRQWDVKKCDKIPLEIGELVKDSQSTIIQ